MKTELVLLFAAVLMLANNRVFSQPWKTNGNNASNDDFIGTTNDMALKFKTNNVLQMKIKKNGDVNIFNNLDVSKKITSDSLHVNSIEIGKSIWLGSNDLNTITNDIYTDNDDLYIQSNPASLFNTIFNYDYDNNSNNGNVGIGTGNPQFPLEVRGDIDITESVQNHGYRIRGITVLQTQWSGSSSTAMPLSNIFVGEYAGVVNSTGYANSFLGFESGWSNTTGHNNTFIGRSAGKENTLGSGNVFVGSESGHNNKASERNTYLGANSGMVNTGERNTFLGYASGAYMTSGHKNVFIGEEAGNLVQTGNENIFIGYNATSNLTSVSNSAIIGSEAIVRASNKIILGNNTQYVGIGLSNDTYAQGPQAKLEIDAGLNGVQPSTAGTVGASGLRFRDLRYGNNPTTGQFTKVLSVNAQGDVILVEASGGGSATANNGLSISSQNNVVLGNDVGGTDAALISDREVPMANYNLVFTKPSGADPNKNRIGIGKNNPARTLDVFDGNGPQLRLSRYGTVRYTDFETTPYGYLRINPSDQAYANNGRVGINLLAGAEPQNTLEINSNLQHSPSASGLRFTNLKSDATPELNPGTGVLSVNENGDVIYVSASTGGTTLGNVCGTLPTDPSYNPLTNNWEVPLNGNNFIFSGQGLNINCVGIGINGCAPNAKLDVFNDSKVKGGSFVTKCDVDPHNDYIGVYGEVNNIPFGCQNVAGVKGLAIGQAKYNSGVWGVAQNGINNMAIYGEATSNASSNVGIQSTTSNGYQYNFGINSEVTGHSAYINYGIRASLIGNNTTINYGIYSKASGSNSINYAGYFVGDVYVSGTTSGTGYVYASDMKLKRDTVRFNNGLETIRNIQPYSFKYNGLIGTDSSKQHTGVIAGQVAQYAPFAIDTLYAIADTTDSIPSEFLGVKSEAILFTSINAIKQLDSITTSISNRIDTLKDNDWYKVGTTTAPTNINDDKYSNGNTFINVPSAYIPLLPYVKLGVYQNYGELDQSANTIFSTTARFQNEYTHIQDKSIAYGIYSAAQGQGCNYRSSANYGGYFKAKNASFNYAGYFESTSSCNSLNNYGIYASVPSGSGFAGYFNGDVTITGNETKLSDIRFKNNIATIPAALNIIDQLNPVSFNFNSDPSLLTLPQGKQYGLIAQQVEQVLPELVINELIPAKYDSAGNLISDTIQFKSLNYNAFLPIALKGIKELKQENDSLKQIIQNYDSRLNAIENMLSQCCSENKSTSVSVTVQTRPVVIPVSDKTVLNQNQPNPFQTITTFSYMLGEEGNVQLVIDDSYGHRIATLVSEYQSIGNYSVDWDASKEQPGLYFYSLMVNGKVLVKKAIKIE